MVEADAEVDLLNQSLVIIGESPFDVRKAGRNPTYAPEKRRKVADSVRKKLDLVTGPSATGIEETTLKKCDENCMPKVIKSLLEKYENSGRSQQIQILTIFAPSMSIRTMMSEFECSQRMAVQAKKRHGINPQSKTQKNFVS